MLGSPRRITAATDRPAAGAGSGRWQQAGGERGDAGTGADAEVWKASSLGVSERTDHGEGAASP